MIKAFKTVLFPSVMFVALFVMSSTSSNAQLREILDRMDAHNKGLNYLESSVTMVKVDAALGEKNADTVQGKVKYIPAKGKVKMHARVDWTRPEETMLVIDKNYWIYRPALKQGYEGKTNNAAKGNDRLAGPLGFLSMSRAELKKNYKVIYIGEETVTGGTKTLHLQLTPITANAYKEAHLWVDGNGMPRQAKVISGNGDSTAILLADPDKNVSVDYAAFDFKFPSGTKVIKN